MSDEIKVNLGIEPDGAELSGAALEAIATLLDDAALNDSIN